MPNPLLLKKLAKLAVKVGANVQTGQTVVLRSNTESRELAREVVRAAYEVGARKVIIDWNDEFVTKYAYEHQDDETLKEVPDYIVSKNQYYVDQNACFISITSPMPGLNKDIDSKKVQMAGIASQQKLGFVREYTMGNKAQWTIIGASNKIWATKVFPDLPEDEAVEALWDAIFAASRVTLDNDPIEDWKNHNKLLRAHADLLNNYNFKELHFKNSLGTDLVVGLVDNHIWAAGGEVAANGFYFNPNIPTEEAFTMPHKFMTQGKVVATKPLNYNGKLIENFSIEFDQGKVVNFQAEKEVEALESILNFDDNARYIGEIALISHDSPISNTNILFYNTLYDENASCHMALGRAYPMNIKNGIGADVKDLEPKGYNNSMVHVDFMFGSSDMEITGITQDGKKIKVFENGNFIV
ncbi:MAG: aminopeptidase [Acholeplasmataceae bacterium]|jgi:aminopeptidase|nr:aminopeptidase [Acholeplasmataceae bacterium]MDD4204277.1 aminopeptidase [Acholeplasmataceae bacterium]MDY0316751.1 aminopeptidase [Acholeplasmatales bacterium]